MTTQNCDCFCQLCDRDSALLVIISGLMICMLLLSEVFKIFFITYNKEGYHGSKIPLVDPHNTVEGL